MASSAHPQSAGITLRRTRAEDMEAVVALDAAVVGHPRQLYFQRRLQAALEQTDKHIQFSVERNGQFVGFIKARKQLGEFGRTAPALLLETVAVAPDEQHHGIASALMERLEAEARRLGVPEIRSTATWRNHAILGFFDRAGFRLSQTTVIECAVRDNRIAAHESDRVLAPARVSGHSATEVDYGGSAANDFDALAGGGIDARTLERGDIDDIVRIDQRVSGQRREAYIHELVEEATNDAAVRLSLMARRDGTAVGFVTARADFGDFGRVEPVAVLDTLGVDPDCAHRGVGHALLAQLFANLGALGVDHVETVVARADLGLLGFFYDVGFRQAQRLAFEKRLS